MPRIFISYRRDDSKATAGRIYDRLEPAFGKENIFMDVEVMPLGVDFRGYLQAAISQADVILIIIGPKWSSILKKRRNEVNDFVRIELESALEQRKITIPILVDGVKMPREGDLPKRVANIFPYLNAFPLSDGPNFHLDMNRLINKIGNPEFLYPPPPLPVQNSVPALRSYRPSLNSKVWISLSLFVAIIILGLLVSQFISLNKSLIVTQTPIAQDSIQPTFTSGSLFTIVPTATVMRSSSTPAVLTVTPVELPTRFLSPTPLPTRYLSLTPQIFPTTVTNTSVPDISTGLPVNNKSFQSGIQVQYSLDMNPQNEDNWMREVSQKLNLRWFKHQVRWEDTEPEKDNFDWSILDMVITSKNQFGLNIMLSIVTAPKWARESGANLDKQGPPANNADYVNFVSQILKRYPGQVQAIEVWNEENIDREWSSTRGLKAENYVSLLKDTYTAVKVIDSGVVVISGAMSPTGFNDGVGAWDDYIYLDQLITAGLLNYADCVGVHHNGYNIGPDVPWSNVPPDLKASFRGPFDNPHHSWSFYSTLQTYAKKVALAGGQQKLCVTEFGWGSSEDLGGAPPGYEFANDVTLQEQADYIVQALDLMKQWGFVQLAFIWNFNYGPQAGWAINNPDVPYSIVGKDWKFRPAYDAIIRWSQNQPK